MPAVEVNLSDELLTDFQRLADQEFVSEEQAAEELLSLGIDAYNIDGGTDARSGDDFMEDAGNNLFDTATDPGDIDDDRL